MDNTTVVGLVDNTVVLKEQSIILSDVKMKQILTDTYECAQVDSIIANLQTWSCSFFSNAGTLLLALLTSKFNKIGFVKAETITTIVWCLFAGCIIGGIATFVFAKRRSKKVSHTNAREAVDKIMGDILASGKSIKSER